VPKTAEASAQPSETPAPTPQPPVDGVKEKVGDYTFLMPLDVVRENKGTSGLYYLNYEEGMGSVSWAVNQDEEYTDAANAESALSALVERLGSDPTYENFTSEAGATTAGNPAVDLSYDQTSEDGEVRHRKGHLFIDTQNASGLYIFEMNCIDAIQSNVENRFSEVVDTIRLEPGAVDGDTALSSALLEDFSPAAFNNRFFNELIIINTMMGEDNTLIIPSANMEIKQNEDNAQAYEPGFTVGAAKAYYYTDENGEVIAGLVEASTEYGVGFGAKKEGAAMSLAFAPLGEDETFTDRLQIFDDIPMDSTDPHSVGSPLNQDLTMVSPAIVGDYHTYFLLKIEADEDTREQAIEWCTSMYESLL